MLLICLFFLILCSHRCCCFVLFFKYFFLKGYELSGEIALKNNHYYYYYKHLHLAAIIHIALRIMSFPEKYQLEETDYLVEIIIYFHVINAYKSKCHQVSRNQRSHCHKVVVLYFDTKVDD